MIPDYKEAATYNIVNVFAFNCMEFCKCRNLIDKFDNVLVAKDYLLTPSEKNDLHEIQNYLKNANEISKYAEKMNVDDLFFYNQYV